MHRLLHRTYKAVQELNAVDDDSSDADREALKIARRYSAKILETVNELCESSSNLSDDEDDMPLQAPDISANNMAEKRVVAVCDAFDKMPDAIEMVEFVARFVEVPTRQQTFQTSEDEGLVRILRGYNFAEHDTPSKMHHAFYPYALSKGIFADSMEAEKVDDLTARLQRREDVMAFIQAQGSVDVVMASIKTGILTVRFISEWRKMSKNKKWKTEYRRKLFSKIYPNNQDDEIEFKRFTDRQEKVMAARNMYMRMFEKYHVAVMLDPIWAPIASYEHGRVGRSLSFAKTVTLLIEKEGITADVRGYNQASFLWFVRQHIDKENDKYIVDFLNEFA